MFRRRGTGIGWYLNTFLTTNFAPNFGFVIARKGYVIKGELFSRRTGREFDQNLEKEFKWRTCARTSFSVQKLIPV